MGCENFWSDDGKGLYKNLSGEITVTDILIENNTTFQSNLFDELDYIIYDFSGVTRERTLLPEELDSIAKVVRLRANDKTPMKVAIVSRDRPDSLYAAQTFCGLLTGTTLICEVFVDTEKAKAWATS